MLNYVAYIPRIPIHHNRINRLSPPKPLSDVEKQLKLYDWYSRIRLVLSQTKLLDLLPFTPSTKGVDPIGIVGLNGKEYPYIKSFVFCQQKIYNSFYAPQHRNHPTRIATIRNS